MNILIVDDYPEVKVRQAIEYLEKKQLTFTYTIAKSYHSAAKYLKEHRNEIDLAIIDLGLPLFDGDMVVDARQGADLLGLIYRLKRGMPIIINSTTELDEEFLSYYIDGGMNIQHQKILYGEWLYEFVNKL